MNADYFPSLVECAHSGGSEMLAYYTALLFTEIFDGYGRISPDADKIVRSINVAAGMGADDFWRACDHGGAISAALTGKPIAVPPDIASRSYQSELDWFESRYISPMTNSLGDHDDLFTIALCEKYWGDAPVAKRFMLHIKGSIDSHDGAIATFINRTRDDPRFSADADVAQWEARRWKMAKKLNEFSEKYPDRFKLAGSPR
jgi:hypothetical protein